MYNYPKNVIIELTNRCNLKCAKCDIWQEAPKTDFDEYKFNEIISDSAFSRIRSVSVTGGEPFMMPGLATYIHSIPEKHPNAYINISSNGTLLEPMVKIIKELKGQKLSLTISYDEHNELVLENLKKLSSYPIKLAMKMTLDNHNHHRLQEIAEQAREIGLIFYIKVIEQFKCHHNRIPKDDINLDLHEIGRSIAPALDLIDNKRYAKRLIKGKMTCNWPRDKIFIGLNNDLYMCRKMNKLGNLQDSSLSNIWKSEHRAGQSMIKSCTAANCASFDYR